MSQVIFADLNPSTTSGTQLATHLNAFKAALLSGLSGTSRPSQLTAGGYWIDTSLEASPNFKHFFKYYTGVTDITVFTINLATGSASLSGSDEMFEIAKISADTAGSLLKLVKARVANNGQVLSGDVIGEIQFVGTDNVPTEPIVCRIRSVALDNMTNVASGGYLSFETTTTGTASIAEHMRLINGRLGIGVTSPTHTLHARGNGAKVETLSDDAVGTVIVRRKGRIAGTGAVQTSDVISSDEAEAIDDTSSAAVVVRERVTATEGHTSSARGVSVSKFITKTGSNTLTEKVRYGVKTEHFELQTFEAMELVSQSIATTATIVQLNADKTIINFTGSTDTEVQGLNAAGVSKTILVHNGSTGRITIKHQNAGATAVDRFKLPKSKDITLLPDASVELFYSSVDSRWKLKSGSGGGGGELTVLTPVSVADGGTIVLSAVESRQFVKVAASGTTGVLSSTPFGAFAAVDPVEVIIVGDDNSATVFLPFNDAAFGCVGNFESEGQIEISKNLPVKAVWYPTTQRFYVSRGV